MYLCNYLTKVLGEEGAPKSNADGMMIEPPSPEWLQARKSDLNPEEVIVGMAECVRCPCDSKTVVDITIGTLFRWQDSVTRFNEKASAKGRKLRSLAVRPVCEPCRKPKKASKRMSVLKKDTAEKLLKAAIGNPELVSRILEEHGKEVRL